MPNLLGCKSEKILQSYQEISIGDIGFLEDSVIVSVGYINFCACHFHVQQFTPYGIVFFRQLAKARCWMDVDYRVIKLCSIV